MPSERSLVKCAEIFWCEDTLLLEYQCSTCMIWFHSHDKCAHHVRNKCFEMIADVNPKQETDVALPQAEEIVFKTELKDESRELIEVISVLEFDSDSGEFHTPELPTDVDSEATLKVEELDIEPAPEVEPHMFIETVAEPPQSKLTRKRIRKPVQPKYVFETTAKNEVFSKLIMSNRKKEDRSLVCELCGASSKTRVQIFMHMHREHIGKDLTCKRCGRQFRRLRDLQIHSRKYPPDPHTCEFCGKTFNLKINFDNHVRIHTGERPFVCQECGQRFVQNSSLKVHMRVAHTGERPFKCGKCPMAFVTRFLMNQHDKREHLKVPRERTHRCEHCDKSFYDPDVLVDHIRTHTGEKPHICEFCNRGFAKKYALSVHRNIHTGHAPCVCKLCDRAFHSSAARRSHEKHVHKLK